MYGTIEPSLRYLANAREYLSESVDMAESNEIDLDMLTLRTSRVLNTISGVYDIINCRVAIIHMRAQYGDHPDERAKAKIEHIQDVLAEEDLSELPDAKRKELDSIPMSADVEHGVRRFRMLGNHQTKDKGTTGDSFKPTAASDERVAILIYSMRIAAAPGGDGKLRWLESSLAMLPMQASQPLTPYQLNPLSHHPLIPESP